MTEQQALDYLREFLMAAVWIGAPMIGAGLVVGIIIGLLQALTSVQEMSLTFAPKLIVMLIVFWMCAGFMTRRLLQLFNQQVLPFIAGG